MSPKIKICFNKVKDIYVWTYLLSNSNITNKRKVTCTFAAQYSAIQHQYICSTLQYNSVPAYLQHSTEHLQHISGDLHICSTLQYNSNLQYITAEFSTSIFSAQHWTFIAHSRWPAHLQHITVQVSTSTFAVHYSTIQYQHICSTVLNIYSTFQHIYSTFQHILVYHQLQSWD